MIWLDRYQYSGSRGYIKLDTQSKGFRRYSICYTATINQSFQRRYARNQVSLISKDMFQTYTARRLVSEEIYLTHCQLVSEYLSLTYISRVISDEICSTQSPYDCNGYVLDCEHLRSCFKGDILNTQSSMLSKDICARVVSEHIYQNKKVSKNVFYI